MHTYVDIDQLICITNILETPTYEDYENIGSQQVCFCIMHFSCSGGGGGGVAAALAEEEEGVVMTV